MYIQRALESVLKDALFKNKVIILYGPRQSGKTTLVKRIVEAYAPDVLFIDCEIVRNNELLSRRDAQELFSLVAGYRIVVFDEAQTVRGIGQVLKTLFDHRPDVQYIATGSSSFDLANEVSEPLTGRSREYVLYPLGITELYKNAFETETGLSDYMRFGGYPGIVHEREDDKQRDLQALVSQYLYKNVLSFDGVRKPSTVTSLLKLLAFQIGNEVSYRELSQQTGASIATVQKYIDLLEKNFVILRIGSYARNQRNEVTRAKKIYFLDLGLRNALIDAFAPMQTTARSDVGALFENCMIVERMKHVAHSGGIGLQQYFWRTVAQHEMDYVEEYRGTAHAFEFKWNPKNEPGIAPHFKKLYSDIPTVGISPRSAFDFVSR
jgi:predicted AAA+ superfamily ATPase